MHQRPRAVWCQIHHEIGRVLVRLVPLFPGCVLVRPDDGGVEKQLLQVRVLQSAKDPLPNPFLGPARETSEHRVGFAKPLRQVLPRGASPCNPQHRVDEQSVVLGGHAWVADPPRKEVLDPNPLVIRDLVPTHGGLQTFAQRAAALTIVHQLLSIRPKLSNSPTWVESIQKFTYRSTGRPQPLDAGISCLLPSTAWPAETVRAGCENYGGASRY